MKYFSYISNEYSLKNSLEKAVYALLQQNNRQVIDASEVETFKEKILQDIEVLNKQNPRCRPFKPDWYMPHFSEARGDAYLRLGGLNNPVCNFHIYHSKN